MESIFASSLSGCNVMTTDGVKIGTVENITMNVKTGKLEYLRIEPNGQTTGGFDRIEDGMLLVPANRIEAKHDYLLVEPSRH